MKTNLLLILSLLFLVTTADNLYAMEYGNGWIPPQRSELSLETIKTDLNSLVDHLCVKQKQTKAINTLKQEVVYAAFESSKGLRFDNLQDLNFHAQQNIRYVLAQVITSRACTLYADMYNKKIGTLCRCQEKQLAQVTQDMKNNWQKNLQSLAICGQKGAFAKFMGRKLKKRMRKMVQKDISQRKQENQKHK